MDTMKMISAFWRRRSLKFWLATGMLMTVAPILITAVAGYLLYHQKIIQPLVEVSSKQRTILQPLQSVQLALRDVSKSMVDFAVDGEAGHAAEYQRDADAIDTAFAGLISAARGHGLEVRDLNDARNSWREVRARSSAILADKPLQGDPNVGPMVEELEASLNRLGRRLDTAYDDVRIENEKTHDQALTDLRISERLAVAAFAGSIVLAILGVMVINRSLVSSMDQLATGAMRLAAGERDHQIEVQIPPELVNVANAFNLMTRQILEQEVALLHAARTDGLTGLHNRPEFDRILAEEIRRGERYGKSVSLIMGDVDHFKSFNDTHGHLGGDEALRVVANTLKESVRDVDKVCRFGGEEFILVLPECDAEPARRTAERVRAAVEARDIHWAGQTARVTISLGVATFPGSGGTTDALLQSADAALYESKENGRNRVTSAG